jgi:hypothetical protein
MVMEQLRRKEVVVVYDEITQATTSFRPSN